MRFLPLIAALPFLACNRAPQARHRVEKYTRLSVPELSKSVWTYQPIREWKSSSPSKGASGYLVGELNAGDRVVLESGTSIGFNGKHLTIDGRPVPTEVRNVYIDGAGHQVNHTFIRTFD
ncbi:hypothetical protein JIN85_11615 [Luteolibacter pohnpeiensis]|uniref:Uncharacterized protein n=1 Tax=Luteolibacter pohnpeiensis TaxID=454153 RepID=A0A934S6E0_9BACT|nr:hypothetical protein [Luteolibacter pohnpeiensis]MBK1883067.1 hypothetical protein [Luteolibacter pohnpeiensis]